MSRYTDAVDIARTAMHLCGFHIIGGDLDQLARAALRKTPGDGVALVEAVATFPLFVEHLTVVEGALARR